MSNQALEFRRSGLIEFEQVDPEALGDDEAEEAVDANIDAALVLNAPTAVASSDDTARAVAGIPAVSPLRSAVSTAGDVRSASATFAPV